MTPAARRILIPLIVGGIAIGLVALSVMFRKQPAPVAASPTPAITATDDTSGDEADPASLAADDPAEPSTPDPQTVEPPAAEPETAETGNGETAEGGDIETETDPAPPAEPTDPPAPLGALRAVAPAPPPTGTRRGSSWARPTRGSHGSRCGSTPSARAPIASRWRTSGSPATRSGRPARTTRWSTAARRTCHPCPSRSG